MHMWFDLIRCSLCKLCLPHSTTAPGEIEMKNKAFSQSWRTRVELLRGRYLVVHPGGLRESCLNEQKV